MTVTDDGLALHGRSGKDVRANRLRQSRQMIKISVVWIGGAFRLLSAQRLCYAILGRDHACFVPSQCTLNLDIQARLESMTGCQSCGNEIPAGWLAEPSGKSASQSFGSKSLFLDMLLCS